MGLRRHERTVIDFATLKYQQTITGRWRHTLLKWYVHFVQRSQKKNKKITYLPAGGAQYNGFVSAPSACRNSLLQEVTPCPVPERVPVT